MCKTTRLIELIFMLFSLLFIVSFAAAAETEGIFTYTVDNEAATITEVAFSGQTEIVVPETLGGYPVTALASRAMTDKTWVLGDDTVASFLIPKTVTSIEYDSFDCADLERIFVDGDNPVFSSDRFGVLFNKDKTALIKAPSCLPETSYAVPDGVVSVEEYAFANAIYLQEVLLPDGLESCGRQAFFSMERLRTIAVPEGITTIDQNSFAYCLALESVSLPSTLQTILVSAFTECASLKEVIIPEGVTSIGRYAFESATALERIVLPASLQTVGRAICGNCPNLAHVYYASSAEDWAALRVATGNYSGNRVDAFATATFHYNFDVTPYETLQVNYDNDLLTISGTGSIPAAETDSFRFWDEHKNTVTALFLSGDIDEIGNNAFSEFPNLAYVILDTASTALLPGSFISCPLLETILSFGDLTLNDASVNTDADYTQIFVSATATVSGSYDNSRYRVVPFSYTDSTLSLNGSITWNSYQFLDTMTAFCLHYNPIRVLKCTDFTFDALPLYGTTKDGEYERIEDNRLSDAQMSVQINEAEEISYNELIQGIVDGSISNFRLIAKDSGHEEIKDTPVEIKDGQKEEGGFAGFIKKAIKWVVRLIDTFLNILSTLRRK